MTSPLVSKVIKALVNSKNVLLYGPPGTGKTWLLSEIVDHLQQRQSSGGQPTLNLGASTNQFGTAVGDDELEDLPQLLDIEWVTFHQNYSYEEFIIGKRPKPQDGGIILEPHFGIMMSIAVKIGLSDGQAGCLLIIDEINRANASQVFGEFITLLDSDYRKTIKGVENDKALKVRLPGIAYENGESEEITMLRGGGTYKLPEDWVFPEHVYVLATMNSVDKAALPLDSALTRRFHRIEMMPDLGLLAMKLDVDVDALAAKSNSIRETPDTIDTLSAEETTVLLLDRLNFLIAKDMGEDFELGHSLVWSVIDANVNDRWNSLINAWDHLLLPQLLEKYAGRNDTLKEILKINNGSETHEAFFERAQMGVPVTSDAPIKFNPLGVLEVSTARNILRRLAL